MIVLDNKTFDRIKQHSVQGTPTFRDPKLLVIYEDFELKLEAIPNEGEDFLRRYKLSGKLKGYDIVDETLVYKILMKILDRLDQERAQKKAELENCIKEFLES